MSEFGLDANLGCDDFILFFLLYYLLLTIPKEYQIESVSQAKRKKK
tara:strand:+ start:741 stop:878 length:138 start_codon:yes stop_codon:yes gene_type:complete